jgi:hypothetical protein
MNKKYVHCYQRIHCFRHIHPPTEKPKWFPSFRGIGYPQRGISLRLWEMWLAQPTPPLPTERCTASTFGELADILGDAKSYQEAFTDAIHEHHQDLPTRTTPDFATLHRELRRRTWLGPAIPSEYRGTRRVSPQGFIPRDGSEARLHQLVARNPHREWKGGST